MTLQDLRSPVADILDGLARSKRVITGADFDEWCRLTEGAETLRWARDFEYGTTPDDLRNEIDNLRYEIEMLPSHDQIAQLEQKVFEMGAKLALYEKPPA